jgi:malate synthase
VARSAGVAAVPGVEILGPIDDLAERVLTPGALGLLARLARACEDRRRQLLAARAARQYRIADGEHPDFLPQTRAIREATWTVAPIPKDLLDRRVEITGPVDRKMIINALNSGARVFMADFEDSHSPTWRGTLEGQRNLYDAVRGSIDFQSPDGKHYVWASRSRPSWCGRAAGTWSKSTCTWTGGRYRRRCSISRCSSSTTRRR